MKNITNEDKEYAIITDMSKMMQGNVGYAKTATVNKVLCSWVKRRRQVVCLLLFMNRQCM